MTDRRPRVYLAGPLGFTDAGKHYHRTMMRPAVECAGFEILDPWPSAYRRFEVVEDRALSGGALVDALRETNHLTGSENQAMIKQCDAVLAIVDGSDVDSGTASEIGYAAALGKPVVGIRTDLRMSADNLATAINLQVAYFIDLSGGRIAASLAEGVALLRELTL